MNNQSRICGKGVGLGLFPPDWLQSQLYEFIEIAYINHTIDRENRKKSKDNCFLAIFGLILAIFLTSQPYDFDAISHIGL